MKWRDINNEIPEDGQACITDSKYGIIEGTYDAQEEHFECYFATSLSWVAPQWVPSDEFWECFED